MKQLKDFYKELSKCSKCGQCQIVCPIYKHTHNECCVSRGKFVMLLGVTKGELKLSKKINKYLDMCLKCGKCTEFCPAEIDAVKILNCAKHEYMKTTVWYKFISFFQSQKIFSMFIKLGKYIFHFNKHNNNQKIHSVTTEKNIKVLYFKGCVNQIFPNIDICLNKIFKNSDIEIISPNFDCCGLPFLSEGNIERFEQAAISNIEKLNCDYNYIVTDCASCENTILNYPKYIDCNLDSEVFSNWGDIIAGKNLKFKFDKNIKVTFHKPCHLKNDIFFEQIIKNCKNVEYIKMDNYDDCCGFAGSFAIKNKELSQKLSKNKAINIQNTGADYVITSCPACILGLKQGLKQIKNKKIKVKSLLEFLSMAE